jgi:hypothetical protein
MSETFYTGPALSSATDKWATPPDLFFALDHRRIRNEKPLHNIIGQVAA